jgi:hypothetical protein
MLMMTEEIFEKLGFERVDVSAEEAGDQRGFYYYSIDIGDIGLISNSDDEAEKNGWECSIFDSMTLKIKGSGDLEDLVRIIRLNS